MTWATLINSPSLGTRTLRTFLSGRFVRIVLFSFSLPLGMNRVREAHLEKSIPMAFFSFFLDAFREMIRRRETKALCGRQSEVPVSDQVLGYREE
jgi:hypothetical protein